MDNEETKFFYIVSDETIIGKYGLSIYHDTKDVGIGSLEIFEDYRKQGYATKAINKIIEYWKPKGYSVYCYVDPNNKNAISLYRKLGTVTDIKDEQDRLLVWFYNNHK